MNNKIDLLTLFVSVDDFCIQFEPRWNARLIGTKLNSSSSLTLAEILTILIWFQASGWRCFKNFYKYLELYHKKDFPNLLSYNRFIEIQSAATIPLQCLLLYCMGQCTGTSFIDATPLKVCHNKRIFQNKVFKDTAARGKSTMGWFFGFKIHIVCTTQGDLLSFRITKGNCDDRKPVKGLCKNLFGKVYADKGYISQKLFEEMLDLGVQIVTQMKKNMKPKIMPLEDRLMLKKRSLVESVFHILKNVLHIDHSRHRSPKNFVVNILAALTAYCFYPNKPSIRLEKHELPDVTASENSLLVA